jgi:MFS transporter, DHA3 family, macrolide efflux protein
MTANPLSPWRHDKIMHMSSFFIIWAGQIVSILATNMSGFAISIWVYQQTGSATTLGIMQACFMIPLLVMSPVAGVWVDRYNRKLMMMLSDLAAGCATIAILVLQALGLLQVWHLCVMTAIMGLGSAFQFPAFSAAISTLVPKTQYSRVNGMMAIMEEGPAVFSPLLAGALLPLIGLTGILTIDVATFVLAIAALASARVPQPEVSREGRAAGESFWSQATFGLKYILQKPSLLAIQLVFLSGNLFYGAANSLLTPMVLARTANNSLVLGSVQTAGAVGGLVGSLLMSAWSGFKKRVDGVLLGWGFSFIFCVLVAFNGGLPFWIAGAALGTFFVIVVNPSNQALWQAKVPPDIQGRVFATRRIIAWFPSMLVPVIAGALADYVAEPAMLHPGKLGQALGGWVGSGAGAGMAVIILLCGLALPLISVIGYSLPVVRDVETILPDHDHR